MDRFSKELNNLLVDTFQSVMKVEEQAVKQLGQPDLSINELHLLEAVGKNKEEGRTISELAQDQGITMPSVTIAVNKLEKKGYVDKVRCEKDGRRVFVRLTRLGRKVNAGHLYFHENMVRNLSKGMTEEEKDALVKGIIRLNEYFKKKINEEEGK